VVHHLPPLPRPDQSARQLESVAVANADYLLIQRDLLVCYALERIEASGLFGMIRRQEPKSGDRCGDTESRVLERRKKTRVTSQRVSARRGLGVGQSAKKLPLL
jgi:hypothetical protein